MRISIQPTPFSNRLENAQAMADFRKGQLAIKEKAEQARQLDGGFSDLNPETDGVAFSNALLPIGSSADGIMKSFMGVAEFKDGAVSNLDLSQYGAKQRTHYIYQELNDGSKLYAAPCEQHLQGDHLVVLESPTGALFMERGDGFTLNHTVDKMRGLTSAN